MWGKREFNLQKTELANLTCKALSRRSLRRKDLRMKVGKQHKRVASGQRYVNRNDDAKYGDNTLR